MTILLWWSLPQRCYNRFLSRGLQSIHYSLYTILYAFMTNKRFLNLNLTHKLFELLLVKAKQFIKHLPTLDHWLGIIYLVKFQPMCLIYVLKTMPNYIYRQIVYHKLD